MRPRYKVPTMIGTAVLAVALAGCGGSSDAASEGQGAGGGQGGAPITITEPQNGASVQVPFTVKYETNAELGPEESGKNHVHFTFDGNEQDYTVVTANEYEITDLPAGQHTVHIALQRADHSPVGPKAQISVNVTSGGTGGGGGGGGGGYDYGGGGGGY